MIDVMSETSRRVGPTVGHGLRVVFRNSENNKVWAVVAKDPKVYRGPGYHPDLDRGIDLPCSELRIAHLPVIRKPEADRSCTRSSH